MNYHVNKRNFILTIGTLLLLPFLADSFLGHVYGEQLGNKSVALPSGYDERVFVKSEPSQNWMDEACKPLNMLSSDLEHMHKEYGDIEGLRLFDEATLNQRQKFCVTKRMGDLIKHWKD